MLAAAPSANNAIQIIIAIALATIPITPVINPVLANVAYLPVSIPFALLPAILDVTTAPIAKSMYAPYAQQKPRDIIPTAIDTIESTLTLTGTLVFIFSFPPHIIIMNY